MGNPGSKLALLSIIGLATQALAADMPNVAAPPAVTDDGSITTPSFQLPFSSFASQEAKNGLVTRLRHPMPVIPDITKMRELTSQMVAGLVEKANSMYPNTSSKSMLGEVPVEIFVPTAGISAENQSRVLIELHGGGFVAGGGGPGGAIESIPLAAVGRIKVVAVDYRMGPEHHFPAASEDVASVYRELLKTYRPENIGIFGCSAGGVLTGETVPWFLKQHLPLPGALGIFCASLHTFAEGDSAQLWPRMGSVVPTIPPAKPGPGFGASAIYFAGASTGDPLAVPGASRDVMKAFPPTLFLTGTRAPEMSGAVESHLELRELGVKSELLLFDGMDHGFFSDPSLPESARAYKLMARFFAENLGSRKLAKAGQ